MEKLRLVGTEPTEVDSYLLTNSYLFLWNLIVTSQLVFPEPLPDSLVSSSVAGSSSQLLSHLLCSLCVVVPKGTQEKMGVIPSPVGIEL